MNAFTCPVCRGDLHREAGSLFCENRHCYDISRRGYVNLLMSQSSSDARHGDGKDMVAARSSFLELGFYDKLCDAVVERVAAVAKHGMFVLDVGCGECYYTAKVASALEKYDPTVAGIDISKDALAAGSKRSKNTELAVASAFDIPVADGRADVILNLFAPHSESEFYRILKSGGTLIRVFPAARHLWELKSALYDAPYENEIGDTAIDGFEMTNKTELTYDIELGSNADVKNLFKMTPYSYKTGAEDEKKLDGIEHFKTRVEFTVVSYKKK